MKSFRQVALRVISGLVFYCVGASAFATSFVVPSDTELIEKADAIVRGVVVSRSVAQSEAGFIESIYEIAVTRRLKGSADEGTFITVRSPGGNLDGRFLLVQSAAHFIETDEVLLFLTYENGRWTPTDMTLGKFRPALTTKGYSVLVRDDEDITGWTRDGRPHVETVRRETEFLRFIEDSVRGLEKLEPYEADATEVLAPAPIGASWPMSTNATVAAATYSARFAVCDAPAATRWPTAIMNEGVLFFTNDENRLTGAGDGGRAAIQAGLAAWMNDGGSAVNVRYAGTAPELAGDGSKNMVVFNDPQNLIAGSWKGSGVIATTYLYGAGSHTFDGEPFSNIAGADVVFQNGYTASESSLEEAITHEIGHAIGLRHSNVHFDSTCREGEECSTGCSVAACNPAVEECSSTSIMNAATIDVLGYALQSWDRNAANALYPVANAIPLPPTNVQALASSGTAVLVSWSGSDGATSYTVWRSDGGDYIPIGSPEPPAATSFLDEFAQADTAYVYRVQAHNAEGSSELSGGDIASTVVYTDPDLTAGMPIKAVHLTELRTAANLLLALAGFEAEYTDPTIVAGSTIAKAVHFQEVEEALLYARNILGLSVPSSLGIVNGAVIPAAHINALRTYAQ